MDNRIITVIDKETRELIATISSEDIIVKDGYEVIVETEAPTED